VVRCTVSCHLMQKGGKKKHCIIAS
jgi:hypothetical protein